MLHEFETHYTVLEKETSQQVKHLLIVRQTDYKDHRLEEYNLTLLNPVIQPGLLTLLLFFLTR